MTTAAEKIAAGEHQPYGGVRIIISSRAALVAVMLPASMVLVQLFSILLVLLSKLALNTGMCPFVLLAYRNLIGAAAVAPLALIFETIILAMGLYNYGLHSTNATNSVIFLNLITVITSLIAIILRELGSYKLVWKDEALRHLDMCCGNDDGSLQAFVIGILIDPKKSAWTLKWDFELLTVVYSGVFTTGVAFVLMSWAVKRRGPIYPPMFNSLAMIATVVMDSVLLGTSIFLGSILGTLLVILGLYVGIL
ncbi:hypothetical protein BAE44_0000244 [Dichanthelium oligosanthes]|uniref:WAT1-related protein n=1 Tax=Dichanthelium oligosanthes TaxID=888268 RepID=A0A1E5WNK5_9POAL|nr:hypothetical protein BAE44_0000244 [Dichanthelium oligosanthes]